MTNNFLLYGLICSFLCGIICSIMGEHKKWGQVTCGLLGFLLGIIGLLIVAVSDSIKEPLTIAPVNPSKLSKVEELEKWFDLKEKGVITEAEFTAKKNSLI